MQGLGKAIGDAMVGMLILAVIIGAVVAVVLWELAQYLWHHIDISWITN